MFKKLRNSMLLFNMITLSFVILVAFALVFIVTYANIERNNERRLRTMSSLGLMPNNPFFSGRNERPQIPERFSAENSASFFLFVRNGEIEYVDSYLDFDESVYVEAFEKVRDMESGKITLEGKRWAFIVTQMPSYGRNGFREFSNDRYTHIVFLDVTADTGVLRVLLITSLCVVIIVILIFFLISYRFSARAILPIEDGYNRQKQFVADASHELRTPLAIISANIDAIETSGDESVESQKEWFGYIREELKRTGKLVEDLLYLAKAEDLIPADSLPIDLSLVCETVCASMEAVLYERDISLEMLVGKNIYIFGDEEKIKQVLYILLDNAGKYTPREGHIDISLRLEQDKAVLRVANTGNGIDDSELPKIFERFYRPDSSRSQETGGFGLGLSIAKAIVERSGGEIFAHSAGGYTTFTVCLKLN